jgi:nicotinamidase-related amidase
VRVLRSVICVSVGVVTLASAQPRTIIDEWGIVEVPPPPRLESVIIEPATSALLVLDVQNGNCNEEERPRCMSSLPSIQRLLELSRQHGLNIIFSVTSAAERSEIRAEVSPVDIEPVVRSGVNKFVGTKLDEILRRRGTRTILIVGTSAHGAVLNTATGAVLAGYRVVVPLEGVSAGQRYAEQYTAWHLVNSPGSRRATTLTSVDLLEFRSGTE